jgi:hypothetical protein
MIFPFSIAYWGASFLDLVLFNLVEFWSDSNPVAMAEYDFDGTLVKEFGKENEKIRLTYTNWGKEIKIEAESKSGLTTLYAFANQPGKLFQAKGTQMIELPEFEGPLPIISGKNI